MKMKHPLAVALWVGLFTGVNCACAQSWTPTSAPAKSWVSVAASADGTKLVAAADNYPGAPIYTSTNSGTTWSVTSTPINQWLAVASSADGTRLMAAVRRYPGGAIYTSTDSGSTWISNNVPNEYWLAIASSADGRTLLAAASSASPIYVSTNSGTNWRSTTNDAGFPIYSTNCSVACSADGTKMVAAIASAIYLSTNSGASWNNSSAPETSWASLASSADGSKLVALAVSGWPCHCGGVYTSTNSGASWTSNKAAFSINLYRSSVASSVDGTKLVAIGYEPSGGSRIFISSDSGATWRGTDGPALPWWSVASSADGNELLAAAHGGGIYNWRPLEPVIFNPPAGQTVPDGVNVTFSVSAYGAPPLAYQWKLNDTNLPGATEAMLTLVNVHLSDSGSRFAVVASNSFGSATSPVALLTVLPALVTTQPATGIAADAVTLNGLFTSGANATTVWFEWGTDIQYQNRTSAADFAGASSLNFSNVITGLAVSTIYHYRAMASNILGTAAGDDATFLSAGRRFSLSSAPITNWSSVASSADGSRLVAVVQGGPIYASTNGGVTWSVASTAVTNGYFIVSSADGNKLALASGAGGIHTSTNGGATWTQTGATNAIWSSLASSADGAKLAAAAYYAPGTETPGPIYLSTNSGTAWVVSSAPDQYWRSIASSADGSKLVAVAPPYSFIPCYCGSIYTSTNSGATWIRKDAPNRNWNAVASSADGTKLVVAELYGSIYLSSDSGATWILRNERPITHSLWSFLGSSAEGDKLAAVTGGWGNNGDPGPIYESVTSGTVWYQTSSPTNYWPCIALSADGHKQVALASGGGIWISQSTPVPRLAITSAGSSLVLSWVVPSSPFELQENSAFVATNWTEVPMKPTLDFTTLHNKVALPLPAGNRFYRLKH
jgi:hypothetical protein